jgi:hypothetical protein
MFRFAVGLILGIIVGVFVFGKNFQSAGQAMSACREHRKLVYDVQPNEVRALWLEDQFLYDCMIEKGFHYHPVLRPLYSTPLGPSGDATDRDPPALDTNGKQLMLDTCVKEPFKWGCQTEAINYRPWWQPLLN